MGNRNVDGRDKKMDIVLAEISQLCEIPRGRREYFNSRLIFNVISFSKSTSLYSILQIKKGNRNTINLKL